MPIVFAFCRAAASVRFIAFATSTTGVLVFEWALSCRRSSLVHGLRTRVFFFGMASIPLSYGSMLLSSQLARSDSIEVLSTYVVRYHTSDGRRADSQDHPHRHGRVLCVGGATRRSDSQGQAGCGRLSGQTRRRC